MKYSVEEKLEIARNALWIIVDKVEKYAGIERIFGQGATETDVVTEAMKQAEYEFDERSKKVDAD